MTDTQASARTSSLPTGTVTLLFTDIEGSTAHWEERKAEMLDALRRHDDVVRAAIESHGGHVFKTIGDAFCAAFWRASDAVAAAIAAQRALAAEDWSAVGGLHARIALHSGSTDERDGDYFGPPVNRVARLLAVAHGGQIVVSGATATLSRGSIPEGSELRDLGEHRLKDLVEAERVWQLVAPGLPEAFPPLRSLESLPNNLPRQLTPLVGRDEVVAQIEALVNEHPLVTLVGTGGVGKTRVALQVGADLLDGSTDGVWFVELAPLTDPGLVAATIASALAVREQAERPLLQTLLHYLKPRRLLLILDNCEHVIDEVARVADAILRESPEVRLLTTSREPLRIAGERVFRMPSLAVPVASDALTAEDALQYGAVALFARRAAASDAKFRLSDESAPIVAEICRRLDGIALAIELAAARVKVLTPRQLAQKLDERFRVLTGGSRTALPRHQTMRALIDWSHDLLSEREQKLFRSVAIFVGGWTLEAAEAVVSDETLDAVDILDLLSSLTEKSLVAAGLDETVPRYRLLESTRAFALEKLAEAGERDGLAIRHAQWAADRGDLAEEVNWTMPTGQYVGEFWPELDDARSAIEWALAQGEVSLAARIVCGYAAFWQFAGGEAVPRRWLEAILPRLDVASEPAIAARAWRRLARLTFGLRKVEAAQRAIELSERCGDHIGSISGLTILAFGLVLAGRLQEAEAANDAALRICRANGLERSGLYVRALDGWATIAESCGRPEEARRAYAEALALATALGDEYQAAVTRLNMGELEFRTGNPERALECVEALVGATSGVRGDYQAINARGNAAAYRLALGDVGAARLYARDALALARGAYPLGVAVAIQHLATVAAQSGDPLRAARLRGYADAWHRSEEYEREPTERHTYEILMTTLREKLTDAEIEALGAEGAQLSEEQAVAEALAVTG